jgi:tetratricopeptide (TPR) repeat protein
VSALQSAEQWIERGRPNRAVELLEPLAASAPDDPDLFNVLGYARALTGDIWGAMYACEKAQALSGDPDLLGLLASLYAEAGLYAHAWQAFCAVIAQGTPAAVERQVDEAAADLEERLSRTARDLGLPMEAVVEGLLDMERGRRLLSERNYSASIEASRRAIDQLGEWPPPHNNLSQALFFHGQPREAMQEVRGVLANHPANLHALANGIRFLAWSGREEEARDLWVQLEDVQPHSAEQRLRMGEAAAILAEHESAYRILRPLGEPGAGQEVLPSTLRRAHYLLAVAEANTGHRLDAERRLATLKDSVPLAAETLDALTAGQSGTGWTDYFRYFHYVELLPRQEEVEALYDLVDQKDDMPPKEARRLIAGFAERFPQIVQVAEKLIWEEMQPFEGIAMLETIGTPRAYAAVRRFALSNAGSDQARMEALTALVKAGEIGQGETVRAWFDGEWREVALNLSLAPGGLWQTSLYAPNVMDALHRGLEAQERGDMEEAEALLEEVLELDSEVKEAYNSLGAIYARRDELARAKEMFLRSLEIDPLYLLALNNLVTYYLVVGQTEEAERLLDPFSDAPELDPERAAFLDVARARILVEQGELESAKHILDTTLATHPDDEMANDLLGWIEDMEYWEGQWERERVWRKDLQTKLRTLEPTVAEALPLYTKEALIATARAVMVRGGWSGLRKKPLIDAIIDTLTDYGTMFWVVARLTNEEQQALRTVLAHGGYMAWDDFDAQYGNDLEESRYWYDEVPETTMGRLRLRGLLAEAKVDDSLYVVVPVDLRDVLERTLTWEA